MPLIMSIERDGELLPIKWRDFHIAAIALASSFDARTDTSIGDPSGVYLSPPGMFDCYPDAAFPVVGEVAFLLSDYGALAKTPLNNGRYVLTSRHKFLDLTETGGEVLILLPGDELRAVRH